MQLSFVDPSIRAEGILHDGIRCDGIYADECNGTEVFDERIGMIIPAEITPLEQLGEMSRELTQRSVEIGVAALRGKIKNVFCSVNAAKDVMVTGNDRGAERIKEAVRCQEGASKRKILRVCRSSDITGNDDMVDVLTVEIIENAFDGTDILTSKFGTKMKI